MRAVLSILLPIFGLILTGWLARRSGALGHHATTELNRFVVLLALPALLFDIVAHASWTQLWQPDFMLAFGIGAAAVFGVTVYLRQRRHGSLPDASIDGLNSAYANTGFMGFPLAAAAWGNDALTPTLIATIITVCVVFAVALILVEAGLQHRRSTPLGIIGTLCRNPLLVAPALGALVLSTGVTLPAAADTFLKLIGSAAAPCALIALGLFLGEKHQRTASELRAASVLVALKLVGQPLITWVLATQVFKLTSPLAHCAVLLAALPTGTGPFMVAKFYEREAGLTSTVVLASTMLSLFTLTAYLSWVR